MHCKFYAIPLDGYGVIVSKVLHTVDMYMYV